MELVSRQRLNRADIIGWVKSSNTYQKDDSDYSVPTAKKEIGNVQISRKLTDIPIALNGHKYNLHPELNHIAKSIEESKSILELEDGWDGFEAKKITHQVWVSAGQFLVSYSSFIHKEFTTIIKAPVFNPGADGSVDISWRTKKARFLINFKTKESKYLATYYGDLYNNIQPIKGSLLTDELLEYLAFWMQNLV